jgi:hypothetical protein
MEVLRNSDIDFQPQALSVVTADVCGIRQILSEYASRKKWRDQQVFADTHAAEDVDDAVA